MALKIHESDLRKSGESLYWHLHRVVELLEQNNVTDEEILAGAYLHHVLDSGKYTRKEMEKEFGSGVTEIVCEYQRISNNDISKIEPKNYNEKVIIQTYLNLVKNPKTLIIRLADKVDNIRSAYVLPKENAEKIAEKAMYLYSPLCRLLGIHRFVVELENEAFKILDPGEYYSIKSYLKRKKPEMEEVFKDTSMFITEVLAEKNIKAKVDYRIKHAYSIYRKAQKYRAQKSYKGLHQIYDIAAMRIIVETIEQCYMVEDILKQVWTCVPEERDDYISNPKPNGYKSIHNTFVVSHSMNLEIQIKTKEMHEENEFGIASHSFYKTGEHLAKNLQTDPTWLSEINFIRNKEDIKIDHFNKYVYVFTPKGDIKQLAKGSTPIDFAYTIHKDLGNACVGATVNGEFQKLSYTLKDGDRVEIKVMKHKKLPSPDWLDFVKTRKAREEIRKSLRKDAEKKTVS